jgi:hypothetical protein
MSAAKEVASKSIWGDSWLLLSGWSQQKPKRNHSIDDERDRARSTPADDSHSKTPTCFVYSPVSAPIKATQFRGRSLPAHTGYSISRSVSPSTHRVIPGVCRADVSVDTPAFQVLSAPSQTLRPGRYRGDPWDWESGWEYTKICFPVSHQAPTQIPQEERKSSATTQGASSSV